METEIHVVGMASVYAGAGNLKEFWETVLSRRLGFREFPRQRMPLDEYFSRNRNDRDKTYVNRAALIDGFEFDWKARRVPKSTYEATDPVHWLALSTAIEAVEDSGADLDALGRERVGVILGNSLTGEVSRANLLRLRWPYVRRALAEGATRSGIPHSDLVGLLGEVEQSFKDSFPVPNEDTLAGALSNVIAGRICNFLDLGGGGYVVDGACASSLVAVATACEALEAGRLDMVIAGGVDISLDPLEMVGFARTGALAEGLMRVYDKDASGFLPGEGCGMLVLMRGSEASRHGLKPWARIAGWGISSDGSGGITAPKASAQAMAMRRCYARSDFDAETLDFIEGHGTGTPVGDRQELLGFLEITGSDEGAELRRTGLTSIKTLFGHTKAAAGAAGLIKAVLAVNQRVLPPLAGIRTPADSFGTPGARIYPISRGSSLQPDAGLHAGVSGAGFGGINCHIAVSGEGLAKRDLDTIEASRLLASSQSAELFILSGDDVAGLRTGLEEISILSAGMSEGELVDLAVMCSRNDEAKSVRAAVVAGSVDELHKRLADLAQMLEDAVDLPKELPGILLGRAKTDLRIACMVPGQGSQFLGMGRVLAERSDWAAERRALWDAEFGSLGPEGLSGFIDLPMERVSRSDVRVRWEAALRDTRIAQPAIVMTALQWIEWLRRVGIAPCAVVGHSLGEIPAMVAAGLLSEKEAIEIVRVRAEACAAENGLAGGMLALKCGVDKAVELVQTVAGHVVVANDNAPDQVVVAGDSESLVGVARRARERGVEAMPVNVSRAFHSKHMVGAAEALRKFAERRNEKRNPCLSFYSVVRGGRVLGRLDPFDYLAEQIMAPVRFREAIGVIAEECDLLVEVGPGSVLSGLARRTLSNRVPVCALEPGPGDLDSRFCTTIGRLFVAGASLNWKVFYADRYWRPFVPAAERRFIENPCARARGIDPALIEQSVSLAGERRHLKSDAVSATIDNPAEASIEDIIRKLVARETGYDLETISVEARLSEDLNLDSIKVAEVRAELRARNIEVPDEVVLGTSPIKEIARLAVRRGTAPEGAVEQKVEESLPSVPMPVDLPVLGFARIWRETEITSTAQPIGHALILHAPERAAEAANLAEQLASTGVWVRIEDTSRALFQIAASDSPRLIALPGVQDSSKRLSEFFARCGARAGEGVESLLLVSRRDLAPVFGFAQSLALEMPGLGILALEIEGEVDLSPFALAPIEPGVQVLRIDADRVCRRMALDLWLPPSESAIPLKTGDVVVISGGAKGITAECALALLRETRARAILLGSSREETPGSEIETTLRRMAAEELEAVYLQCDVTDPASVRAALSRGQELMGTQVIAGLVHGAGVNIPAAATRLDPAALRREYDVKVEGFRNLLEAIDPDGLNLCVAFGSVIGVLGMRGNSGYALANEVLVRMLEDFKRARPITRVACPAYSVWSEVGMGAKLNVLESLQRQNIAPIPVDEGTRWFLECCRQPNLPIPLVITAPMLGLPTWQQARGSVLSSALPYVDDRKLHEPGVLLVSRPYVNPEREIWLKDHAFRGTLLFPTVQALTAMGGGARVLAGLGDLIRFKNLKITRPIVAAPNSDTPIELDVRIVDGLAGRDFQEQEWIANLGSPGSALRDPAFSVRCCLGVPEREDAAMTFSDQEDFSQAYRPVPPETGQGLYESILFQGPMFRRIEALLKLDLNDDAHRRGLFQLRRERTDAETPIPDTFFLDAMLQSVQVLVPKDRCLPVGIDEIVFYAGAREAGTAMVEAEITEKTPKGYVTRVRAWNVADGAPVARYEGYRVDIVETRDSRPDAHALFDPLAADRSVLSTCLEKYPDLAELKVALNAIGRDESENWRQVATLDVASLLDADPQVLSWNADDAPMLADRPEQGIAVAHDSTRLLTVCGLGRVGCALEQVGAGSRFREEGLPAFRKRLWQDLSGALNDPEHAAALVRVLHEALRKAGADDTGLGFAGMQDSVLRFRAEGGGLIIGGILELALAGPVAIALVRLGDAAEPRRVTHYTRDIEMTFKDALPPLKSPTASIFFAWMGALREEAMAEIRPELAHAFSLGGKGMVTNGTRLRILRPLQFAVPLRAWVWLDRVLSTRPSTFELGFQWAETGPDGTPRRIVAEGIQRLTWVGVGPEGHVTVEAFPEFFARFIAERLPSPSGAFMPPLGRLSESPDHQAPVWRRGPACIPEYGTARTLLETDETHSNFVGNIYFSHAAVLAERACLKVLRGLGACSGGFFATTLQLDHLGEAMPGDTLEAEARLVEVGEHFCVFELSLVNRSRGDVKIATGRARYRLFESVPNNEVEEDFESQPMPEWLRSAFAEETP